MLVNTGFHVLALNETNVDNDVPDQIIDIDGYKNERKDRTSRGVGIAIYLRNYLNCIVRRDIVDFGLEIICVEIKPLKCRPFIIVAWYRPPSDPVISFDLLEKVLSSLDREEKEFILIDSFLSEVLIVIFRTKLLIVTTIPYIYQMFMIFLISSN